ncbi:MAG: 4Fe-4S dicluster domain-containing protein [bacterium]|nr:4Fe-4S dicluster domain-containing protein [bacterium]
MKRRDFFKIMGIASGAAIAACNNNSDQKLLPYLVPPEDGIIPGVSHSVSSTCTECPAHCGLHVTVRDGKAIKMEGNPTHRVNEGALCIRGQASLARLYHPDRLKLPLRKDDNGSFKEISWDEAIDILDKALSENKDKRNVWLSSRNSGSINGLIDEFCLKTGIERLKEIEIFNNGAIKKANLLVFGRSVVPQYGIDKSDVLVSFGADLMGTFVSPVQWGRQYAKAKAANHLKWHHLEPHPSISGSSADHRVILNPGSEVHLLAYLLRGVEQRKPVPEAIMAKVPDNSVEQVAQHTGVSKESIEGLKNALNSSKNPLVISGGPSTANRNGMLTALYTALLQWSLNMVGQTVDFVNAFSDETVGTMADVESFNSACGNGQIGVALFSKLHGIDVIPGMKAAMEKASFKVAITQMKDAVADMSDLVLPLSNPLESWGDTESWKGVFSVVQPTIEPRHNTRSEGDILLNIMGVKETYRDHLSREWQQQGRDEAWINEGFVTVESSAQPVSINAAGAVSGLDKSPVQAPYEPGKGSCLAVIPSVRTFDGRSADLQLLTEIPDPLSAITYGKSVAVSLHEATQNKLTPGDIVEFEAGGGKFSLPVSFNPGLTEGMATLPIDTYMSEDFTLPLSIDGESGQLNLFMDNVTLRKTGETSRIVSLSGASRTDEFTGKRQVFPNESVHHGGGHEKPGDGNGKGNGKDHDKGHEAGGAFAVHPDHTLYPKHEHKDYRWGMAIDLDSCTGCSACVAACYVENNLPMVGEEEHLKGREMSWLRIEPHYRPVEPEVEEKKPEFLPMLCQHCDSAPCENVCPVLATYHNEEGLNVQVYNRCVGTRYCANNCPYKVRRFNWFDHEKKMPLYDTHNPDISVRSKGIMEKCTFCIQRIRAAKDVAKDDNRKVKDGEIQPACAQTCPTGAITFGNIEDPDSKVSQLIRSPGAYRVLDELGTQPAVFYIKRQDETEKKA